MRQLLVRMLCLIRKDLYELVHKKWTFLGSLVISFAAGMVIVFITEADAFNYFYSAQSVLFALSCAVIILGVIVSSQEICSDYEIILREMWKGVSVIELTISRSIKYTVLSFLMSFSVIAPCVCFIDALEIEMLCSLFIVTFLVMLASSLCGLIISAYANNRTMASNIVPIFILLQIVLSGRFFNYKSPVLKNLSTLSLSRWLLDAYLKITNTENIELAIKIYGEEIYTKSLELPSIYPLIGFFVIIPAMILALFLLIYVRLSSINKIEM